MRSEKSTAGAGAVASPIGLPHPPQNLAAGSFSKPQAGQGEGSGMPHWEQNRLVAAFSAMQPEQRIGVTPSGYADRVPSTITEGRRPWKLRMESIGCARLWRSRMCLG